MSTTYNFEELDDTTHEYLVAVRDSEGRGAPGVFAATKDSLPTIGLIAGPIIIIVTLLVTLVPDRMSLSDPTGLALLQTAGLLVGVWLLSLKFRTGGGKVAGNWVYVDPLFAYEAFREQVTITPVEDAVEAVVTANYNNDAYTNSTLSIVLSGENVVTFTVPNENRAEQMRVFLNYLAWARGPEGGDLAKLDAATLGGVAKYVARNGDEPKDAEGSINLNLVELDITEVPEEQKREGGGIPSFLPYVFLLLFAVGCFFVFSKVINPPRRDKTLYDIVMKDPEPMYLRLYLVDSRNKLYREKVTERLSQFYEDPIKHVKANGSNPELREAMAKVLDSLRTSDSPLVSMDVREISTPPGQEGGKAKRESDLREQFVKGIYAEFSKQYWGTRRVQNQTEDGPPQSEAPIGEQLIAFIEKPEGAEQVHFDIAYEVKPVGKNGDYQTAVTVKIRTNIAEDSVGSATFTVPGSFDSTRLDAQIAIVSAELIKAMVGQTNPLQGLPPNPFQPEPGF